jgi:tRNA dimethylallyltransferase
LALARRFDATIVNADSMQVYRDLRVLTARPNKEDEAQAPHLLFGVVDGAVNHSVGLWLNEATAVAERIFAENRLAIFVGGSGLYLQALINGLSDIPAVPEKVRAAVRAEAAGWRTSALHERLAVHDPATASQLRANDRQRILRALEVFEATGRSLAAFQGRRGAPFLEEASWAGLFLAPERAAVNASIDARFDAMLKVGALEEVEALAARRLDPALPVMRAHGVRHLIAYLGGRSTLEEAAARAKLDTRQYAKRQFTWARHQMKEFAWVAPDEAIEAGARAIEALACA